MTSFIIHSSAFRNNVIILHLDTIGQIFAKRKDDMGKKGMSKKRQSSDALEEESPDAKKNDRADIIRLLMSNEGEDPTDNRKIVFKCMRHGCDKIVSKFKQSGYTNPFDHLCRCYGTEEEVYRVYYQAKAAEDEAFDNSSSSIKNHFSIASAKSRERAMHAWIRLIVLRGIPVSYVEDPIFRSFSKYSDNISHKAVVRTIFQLVILVEQKVKDELAKTSCGAIMHDAWTRAGIHYVALFACYMKEKKNTKPEPFCTLLSVSPMPATADEDDTSPETAKFNAKVHANYFTTTLHDYYDIDLKRWAKAIIADNAPTNIKTAKILKIPHVGCCSHKLNLDVELMVSGNSQMKETISTIHDVMACAKQKLRNAAVLRNITDLRPVLENKTRWSGKVAMLARFVRLRDDLVKAADHGDTDGLDQVLDRSSTFLSNTIKYEQWMSCINTITKKLQEKCLSLAKAHHLLDILESEVNSRKDKQQDKLFGCTFVRVKSSLDNSSTCPNKDFETGVVKIQLGKWADLSDAEKSACLPLLKPISTTNDSSTNNDADVSDGDDNQEPGSPDFEARVCRSLEERENEGQDESPYVNCNFIFGSTAEVERLWSISSYILTKQRRRMTPQLFESILFLRYNERFWDLDLVVQAMKEDRMEQYSQRVEKLVGENELEDRILDAVDALHRE
jgi:hypothetical protein